MKDLKKKKLPGRPKVVPIKQIDLNQSRDLVDYLIKDNSRRLRYWLLLTFGLLLAGYLGWQLYQIVSPPELIVEQPADGITVKTDIYLLRGHVEQEAVLEINQELILPDNGGNFIQEVNLQPGANVFVFTAKKRYSRSVEISRQIFYKPTSTVQKPTWKFIN